uniref:F-box domain-containing protein n=1 Tax=Moniliophthora roreri TaxID=221103 RepID=A0A0W0FPL2_MONRR
MKAEHWARPNTPLPQAVLQTSLCDECDKSFVSPFPVPAERPHSNHVPSEDELANNLASLAEDEHEVAQYDTEVSRIREVLGQFKKTLFEKRISERRNLVSVKREVPVEVWTEILSHLCFGYDTKSGSTLPSLADTRLVARLCQVEGYCQQPTAPSVEYQCRPSWYSSRPRPGEESRPIINSERCDRYFTLQWEDSYFLASYYIGDAGRAIFSMLMGEMHWCESLAISLNWEMFAAIDGGLRISFPTLRSFRTDVFYVTRTFGEMDWLSDGIEKHTPKLVGSVGVIANLTFPYLQHFNLDVHGSLDEYSKLFQSFSFLSLKILTTCGSRQREQHGHNIHDDLDWSSFRGLMERSSTLEKFTLHFPGVPLSYVDIILMLCECPRLEQLLIVVGEGNSTALGCIRIIASGICPPDGLEPLLPRLRQVVIQETCAGKPVVRISQTVDGVVRMAESRPEATQMFPVWRAF